MIFSENKNKKWKPYVMLLAFFILAGFLFFGNAQKAQAAYCVCSCPTFGQHTYTDVQAPAQGGIAENGYDKSSCSDYCGRYHYKRPQDKAEPPSCSMKNLYSENQVDKPTNEKNGMFKGNSSGTIKKGSAPDCAWFYHPVDCTLLAILGAEAIMFDGSQMLFTYVVQVKNFHDVVDNKVNYASWVTVRDLLNIFFILVLVFSAFATIFQVQQYNYKKILLTLVIMALLVNFSYPISRFIVDISNTLMYTIIKAFIPTTTNPEAILAGIAEESQLGFIFNPREVGGEYDTSLLIISVIFAFILVVSFVVIGILLLVRMVALAILIIFSPLGYVGSIFPSTSNYASKFWDSLFKYSFFGPIMILNLYIGTQMMGEVANLELRDDMSYIAKLAFFSIPVVIIWMGLGIAESMSIAGAGAVVGGAKRFMNWSARTLTGYRLAKAGAGAGLHWADRKLAETKGLRYLSPMAMKAAWKQRSDRADRKALSVSTGAIQNTLNSVIGHASSLNPVIAISRFTKGFKGIGGDWKNWADFKKKAAGGGKNVIDAMDIDRTDYNFQEQMRYKNEEKKRIAEISKNSDFVFNESQLAQRRGEPGDLSTILAANELHAESNDFNFFMGQHGEMTDPQKAKLIMARELAKAGMTSTANIAKALGSTGESAFQAGGFSYGGMSKYIGKGVTDTRKDLDHTNVRTLEELKMVDASSTGTVKNPHENQEYAPNFYLTTEEEQGDIGAAKAHNVEAQTRQKIAHPDSYYLIDAKGDVQGVHNPGKKFFNKLDGADVAQVGRSRDALEKHHQAWKKYNSGKTEDAAFKAQIDSMIKDNPIIGRFLKEGHDLYENGPKTRP